MQVVTAVAVGAGTWMALSVPIAAVSVLGGLPLLGILLVLVLAPLCAVAGYRVAYVDGY